MSFSSLASSVVLQQRPSRQLCICRLKYLLFVIPLIVLCLLWESIITNIEIDHTNTGTKSGGMHSHVPQTPTVESQGPYTDDRSKKGEDVALVNITQVVSSQRNIRTYEDNKADVKESNLSSYVSLYSYFDSQYQPMSVNGLFRFYYEENLDEHKSLSSLHASPTRGENGKSTNTPLMYPMLAPIHYITYETPSSQSSTPTPPRFSSCTSLLRRDAHEYSTIIRDSINFYDYPKYHMPWYFYTNQESRAPKDSSHADKAAKGQTSSGIRDGSALSVYHSTMPLCGRTLVRFLENPAPGVPIEFTYDSKGRKDMRLVPNRLNEGTRPQSSFSNNTPRVDDGKVHISMKAKSVDAYYKEPIEHQSSVYRVVVRKNEGISKDYTDSCNARRTGLPSQQFARVIATANTFFNQRIYIENCGASGREEKDIFIHARLIGEDRVLAAEVVPVSTDGGSGSHLQYDVQFQVPDILSSSPSGLCHPYYLEIKYVHINGRSTDHRKPYSLGVVGIRANVNGRKAYRYNIQCDFQRHVYGSPLLIEVIKGNTTEIRSTHNYKNDGDAAWVNSTQDVVDSSFLSSSASLISVTEHRQCTRADHTSGQWVRFQHDSSLSAASNWCQSKDNRRFCSGNPVWLTDAAGYNSGMLWAPTGCAYTYWTPPKGPTRSCVRHREGRGVLLLVGDSVMREYGKNCELFDFSKSNLVCVFNNIRLAGQYYSVEYAKNVIENIIDAVVREKAVIFATNIGIHHMIGPCSTAQWTEIVDLFAREWESRLNKGVFRVLDSLNGTISGQNSNTSINGTSNTFIIEKAVWISSPTIHYARKGMSHQRALIWNDIAISRLRPLGFVYLNAFAPTNPRQEGSWDGLHYSSFKGKKQTKLMNPLGVVRLWNGGISSMLFTMLLNIVCFW